MVPEAAAVTSPDVWRIESPANRVTDPVPPDAATGWPRVRSWAAALVPAASMMLPPAVEASPESRTVETVRSSASTQVTESATEPARSVVSFAGLSSVYGPVPRRLRAETAMAPVSVTAAPAWRAAVAVDQMPLVAVSKAVPIVNPSASVKVIAPPTAAVPAASRVARDTVSMSLAWSRLTGWPPALRVSATRFPTVIVAPACWVIVPEETRRRLVEFAGAIAALTLMPPAAASPTRRTPVVVIRSNSPSDSSRAAAASVKGPRSMERAAAKGRRTTWFVPPFTEAGVPDVSIAIWSALSRRPAALSEAIDAPEASVSVASAVLATRDRLPVPAFTSTAAPASASDTVSPFAVSSTEMLPFALETPITPSTAPIVKPAPLVLETLTRPPAVCAASVAAAVSNGVPAAPIAPAPPETSARESAEKATAALRVMPAPDSRW